MDNIVEEEVENVEPFWKPPYHQCVLAIIKSVGWYVVGICIVLMYTWPTVKKIWQSWKKKRDEKEYDAKYHKNIDLSSKIMLATQLAREKQQEKYLKERELVLQKEEERLEKKRQEVLRLEEERSSGSRLGNDGSSGSSSSKTNLKGEYNPLMGSATKRYVPPKRSCCKKGGCG